jgi:DHA1 family bicyclomycin/chloramphenicol resistance-like MFS transporter
LIAILGGLAAFGPMSIDMYLPALPTIGADLGADAGQVQLSLSLFFIGAAVGQMLYGPLSDRFGRRPLLFIGIAIYVATSLAAALAADIEQLIWFRGLQALGASAASVISRAIVGDVASGDQAAALLSVLTLVMGLAPLAAPLVGGQILIWLGWRAIFAVLAAYGVVCLAAVALAVPETNPPAKRLGLSPLDMGVAYLSVLGHRRALGCLVASGAAFAGMFAYISGTPFVYIEYFGVPPQYYSFLFGLNIAAIMAGAFANSRLVSRVGRLRMLGLGTSMVAAAGLALLAAALTGVAGLTGIVLPLFFYLGALNLIAANAMARVLDFFPSTAGTVAALFGMAHFGLGAVTGALVGQLHDGTPVPMAAVIAACGAVAFLARCLLVREPAVLPEAPG